MDSVEWRLAAIGYGTRRGERCDWRAMRVSRPRPAVGGVNRRTEPAHSPALQHWRNLLAKGRPPLPYRITRMG